MPLLDESWLVDHLYTHKVLNALVVVVNAVASFVVVDLLILI